MSDEEETPPWTRNGKSKAKRLCDVCELPDGDGLNLQRCVDCGTLFKLLNHRYYFLPYETNPDDSSGVCVHDRCYGIIHIGEDDDDDDEDNDDDEIKLKKWKCHACSGKLFLPLYCLYTDSRCLIIRLLQSGG
jgi:hypothetical protein